MNAGFTLMMHISTADEPVRSVTGATGGERWCKVTQRVQNDTGRQAGRQTARFSQHICDDGVEGEEASGRLVVES